MSKGLFAELPAALAARDPFAALLALYARVLGGEHPDT